MTKYIGYTSWRGLAIAILGLSASLAVAEEFSMTEKPDQVAAWNRFTSQLEGLHQRQIAAHRVRTEVSEGGYHGEFFNDPDYYVEQRYYTVPDNRLLSTVQREKDSPDNIHTIEVSVFDDQGRVIRDYLAAYLPWGRNAPVQTLVNLHHYGKDLHSFRQFDASGNRLYEQCQGSLKGKPVDISLESYEITAPRTEQADYRACFGSLPQTVGKYLTPQ